MTSDGSRIGCQAWRNALSFPGRLFGRNDSSAEAAAASTDTDFTDWHELKLADS